MTRLLLGIVEASFFPGALFLISKWYRHDELGLRTTLLFCGNTLSNAFGALLASAILDNMQGVLGAAAWRWLFYIEGALTILVALLASLVLPDFPETTKAGGWLSAEEVALAVRRMRDDSGATARGASGGGGLANGFWMAVADPNVYVLTAVLLSQSLANAFTMWFPTIVATLGYGRTATLLLCAPPYLLAAVLAFFVSRCASPSPLRSYSADRSTKSL